MEHFQILEEERIADERSALDTDLATVISEQPLRTLSSLRPALSVDLQATAADAIEQMAAHRRGCVLVVDDGRLVGVFSERDVLLKIAAAGRAPESVPIREVMTPDPECLTPNDSLAYALHHMSVGGFRHIPLVDHRGRPAGVIAMRTIVEFMVDLVPSAVLNLPPSPSHSISREREGA